MASKVKFLGENYLLLYTQLGAFLLYAHKVEKDSSGFFLFLYKPIMGAP